MRKYDEQPVFVHKLKDHISYYHSANYFQGDMFFFSTFYIYYGLVLVQFSLQLFPDLKAHGYLARPTSERTPLLGNSDSESHTKSVTKVPQKVSSFSIDCNRL